MKRRCSGASNRTWGPAAGRRWLIGALSASLLAVTFAPAVAGEPPSPVGSDDELQFRRVYAPADRFADWPFGGVRYIPIETSEFERLLEAAQHTDRTAPGVEGVQLAAAQYHARLGDRPGDDTLSGEATLTVTGQPDSKVLLPLEPLGLAISRASWDGQPPRVAALGRNANGRVGVLVDKPGDLKLAWSLRGRRGPQGELVFTLDLPHCAANHLLLDLPARLIPSVDFGVVQPAIAAGSGVKSWRIELGGRHHWVLRLAEAGASEQRPPALLHQRTAYEFSPRGVDVTAELHLDVEGQPLRQLTIEIDPRLRLVAARAGQREVPWTVSETAEGPLRVVLDLPEPISGKGRTVRLSALAALEEGEPWHLPQLTVEHVAWIEGTLAVVVPRPLVLERLDLDPMGCTQLNASPLAAPLSGESLEFRCFQPNPSVEVVLTRPIERLHVDTGSIVEMGASGITCRAISEITLRQDEQFSVAADLEPNWEIDSVALADAVEESDAVTGASNADRPRTEVPAERPSARTDSGVIDDWQVESLVGGHKRLDVRLKQSVSARQPLRLLISGHRSEAPAQGLPLAELEMLRFQANIGRRWMAVRAADAHELKVKGAGDLTRLDPQQFTASERRLFPEPHPTGLVFVVDDAAERLEIAIVGRKPTYTGEINVDLVADGKTLTETYTLRCSPPSARVERVVVLCSHARSEPLRFSLAGASGGQISARRLTEEPLPRNRSKAGEAWELTLRLPRAGPFEIRAVRSFPFTEQVPLSLVSLADAQSQRGTLTIRALGETGIAIENRHRLRLIPAEPGEAEVYPTTRDSYRYEPRDASSSDPAIIVRPTGSSSGESGAWVWQSQLESRLAQRDTTLHLATWYVQTRGRSRLSFTLPPAAELRGVTVDDAPLPDASVAGFGPQFSIDLPSGKQFVTVALSYIGAGGLPRLAGSISAAWPEIDVPVLARRWKLWLPPGYELPMGNDPLSPAPSWSQRLFGPLGRPTWEGTFQPLRLADWTALLPSREEGGLVDVQRVMQTMGDVVEAHADSADVLEFLQWGRLTELLAGSPALSGVDVLVDVEALRQIGLRAGDSIPYAGASSASELGRLILDQSELFLLYNDRVVLLTSAAVAASQSAALSGDRGRLTASLGPGPLADELAQNLRGGNSSRYVPLALWSRLSAGLDVPWRTESAAAAGTWATRGWSMHVMPIGSRGEPTVTIVRMATMQSCAWAIFLLTLALGIWWKPTTRLWLVVAVVVLAAICLIVSIWLAPLAAAALSAGLCTLAWNTVQRRPPVEAPARAARTLTPSFAAPAMLLISLSLAVGAAVQTCADEPAATASDPKIENSDQVTSASAPTPATRTETPPPASEPAAQLDNQPEPAGRPSQVYRVFVPVDQQRQPKGTQLYVPVELFRRLSERAARAMRQPGDWMMTRAYYQVVLGRESAQQSVSVAECNATFELEVFTPGVELDIPIAVGGVLTPASARLDGEPIELVRSKGGDHVVWKAEQTGTMRLEVSLAPKLQSDGASTRFELPTPALPISTVSVSLLGDPVGIEVPGAWGSLVRGTNPAVVQAELGACGRVVVSWSDQRRAPAVRANVEVEELLWVNLQAGAPVIDARFKCRAVEGRVRRLRILADRRLQLLDTPNQSTVLAIHATPGDPVALDLELAEPVEASDREVVVDLSFLMTGTPGIGKFQLPRLEASGVSTTKRLLAVTLDPALHYEELGDDVKPQSSLDFLAAWGPVMREPQLAYAIPQGAVAWALATRPPEVRNVVEQQTVYSFGRSTAKVHCSAQLSTSGGHNFQLRLAGPPGLEIQSVSLLENGLQRVARWSTDRSGAITVFLTGAVSGRQEFSLDGQLPALAGDVPLSSFQWPGAELKKNGVDIFRQAATLIEMGETAGAANIEIAAEERLKPEWGRLVASYVLDDPQARIGAHLSPNQPESEGQQVLVVNRDNDVWTAALHLQLHVGRGLIDVLRFDIPSQWVEPFEFDQNVIWEVVPIPGENRRQLIVRPLAPISGDYALRIDGVLKATMGDRLGVSDLALGGVGQLERYVVLPQQLGAEHVDWDTPGLTPLSSIPADVRKWLDLRTPMRMFHAAGEHFQAALHGIQHTPETRVLLADVQYAWRPDGISYGVCAFDLSPTGASSAVIHLPSPMTLVSLTVAELPAAAVPAGENSWRFPLGPPQLPQHIEAVFRTTASPGLGWSGPVRFEAPTLEGLEVDQTLWSVYGPQTAGLGEVIHSPAATAIGLELARLEATRSVLALAAHVASEQIPEEMNHWEAPWKERLLAARQRVSRLRLTDSDTADRRDLETWTRKEAELAARLGIAGSTPPILGGPAFEPLELLSAEVAGGRSVTGCQFSGSAAALTVIYPQAKRGDLLWRLAAAVLLVIVAGLLAWKRPVGLAIRLSPALLLITIGACWWFFLAPSVAGMVIVLATITTKLISRLRLTADSDLTTLPTG